MMSDQALDWVAFSARFFPDRRRHDLEVLQAYGAYRKDRTTDDLVPPAEVEAWEGEGGRSAPETDSDSERPA